MKLHSLLGLAAFSSFALVACASADDAAVSAEAPLETTFVEDDTEVTAKACPMIPGPSKSGIDGAWVRGVAHFDPSHFAAGAKPVLRVVLRHSFALVRGEEKIGGRLHGWTNVPIDDPSSGSVAFAIDMAENHTMWSEGNGTFHVVFIIDEDDNNNLDVVATQAEAMAAAVPGPNELSKIADVDISCHAPSPCSTFESIARARAASKSRRSRRARRSSPRARVTPTSAGTERVLRAEVVESPAHVA